MSHRPLCHLLYTNAPSQGSVGFRVLPVNFLGSAEELKAVEGWLTGLKLSDAQQRGWAVHSFFVDRKPCFALAIVERSSFAHDEHGRAGGHLAHALMVLLEEWEPAGDFGLALFDKARSFYEYRSGPLSLDAYMEGVKRATDLNVPELDLTNFRGLDPSFLAAFYTAACAGGNGEVSLPGYTSDDDLTEHLLAASSALPPRLRLDLPWRVGLAGKEGFAAHAAQAQSAAPPARNLGTAYLETIWSAQADRVARIASNDWGVRQWSGLQQAIVRSEAEESQEVVAASTPDPDPIQESEDMAKKRSAAGSAPAAASPKRGKSAADFEAEYQAIQKQLQDYFDQRLGQLGAPPTPGSAPTPAYVAPGEGDESGWVKWRPEIYFLILLLLGGVAYRSLLPKAPPDPPDPTVSPASAESTPKSEETETPAAAQSSDPLAEWKAFVEGSEAAQWFQNIAENRGLKPSQVSDKQRALFNTLADLRSQGKELDAASLTASRIGSFEYVYARWASDNGYGDSAEDIVTQDPSEAAGNIKILVSDLGLTKALGAEPSVNDANVQAEVTLAWIRLNVSP